MNIENAQKLLGQLERLPDRQFNMDLFLFHDDDCGTVGCVAGWATQLNRKEEGHVSHEVWAKSWLDLTSDETYRLFYAENIRGGRTLDKVSKAEMLAELRAMIEEAQNAQA